MDNKARLLVRDRIGFGDAAVAYLVIWRLPRPLAGSAHRYKYRLAYVVAGTCVLRYDNETGKGDHRHVDHYEFPYAFAGLESLREDFLADIVRWNHENSPD